MSEYCKKEKVDIDEQGKLLKGVRQSLYRSPK